MGYTYLPSVSIRVMNGALYCFFLLFGGSAPSTILRILKDWGEVLRRADRKRGMDGKGAEGRKRKEGIEER